MGNSAGLEVAFELDDAAAADGAAVADTAVADVTADTE
jgi:hypothetical protein